MEPQRRSRFGPVFERATSSIWLIGRGAVSKIRAKPARPFGLLLEMSALFDPVLDRSTRSLSARIEQGHLIPAATLLFPSHRVML
jgi:hypothetical protein